MSKHNYNHIHATGEGQVDPRFDQGYGRFMAGSRHNNRRAERDSDARDRVEKRSKGKKMKRDLRFLGE